MESCDEDEMSKQRCRSGNRQASNTRSRSIECCAVASYAGPTKQAHGTTRACASAPSHYNKKNSTTRGETWTPKSINKAAKSSPTHPSAIVRPSGPKPSHTITITAARMGQDRARLASVIGHRASFGSTNRTACAAGGTPAIARCSRPQPTEPDRNQSPVAMRNATCGWWCWKRAPLLMCAHAPTLINALFGWPPLARGALHAFEPGGALNFTVQWAREMSENSEPWQRAGWGCWCSTTLASAQHQLSSILECERLASHAGLPAHCFVWFRVSFRLFPFPFFPIYS